MLCLIITCLCMLSFLLNDFSQTEQNQLMPASQEQSVHREKGRMLRIYIGLLLVLPSFTTTTFLLFSFSITPITFLLFSFSTITTFLYFLPPPRFYCFLPPPPPPNFYFFPSSHSIKDRKLPKLVQFGFLQLFVQLISASFSYGQPLHNNYIY